MILIYSFIGVSGLLSWFVLVGEVRAEAENAKTREAEHKHSNPYG